LLPVNRDIELANYVEEVPERYVPGLMRGQLVEAEHLGRYLWAGQIAAGKRVLDAGCGMAYGCRILSEASASQVDGIDIAPSILDAARPTVPENCHLQVGDVRSLPFANDAFDLVVCFEVLSHVDEPDRVLAELARVLSADGVLIVSSPNRERYPAGNPHHIQELTPAELQTALAPHFGQIRLAPQQSWNAAVIGGGGTPGQEPVALEPCRVYATLPVEAGSQSYAIAVASNAELPQLDDLAVLAKDLEFRQWLETFENQRRYIDELEFRLAAAEAAAAERAEIRRQLLTSEQQLAELPDLRDAITVRDQTIRELSEEADQLDRARRVMDDMRSSLSWRITAPLRQLKRALKDPDSSG
jgi:ubiquinone/menaquinone biosynthesis C-methylase UbiE